jgi:hypothetical protein
MYEHKRVSRDIMHKLVYVIYNGQKFFLNDNMIQFRSR